MMTMNDATRVTRAEDLTDLFADAAREGTRILLQGGGSKADMGAPVDGVRVVDMRGFAGVIDYDPPELVLTVGAGTPLKEIEALVAAEGQMLAFEPFDHGPVFRRPAGCSTIGGVVAAGVSGPLRLTQGAARDHLLGFEAVSGRGERFVGGAKVVKNVTGYDLPKLMAGSWGRLTALTQLTFKVLPRPRRRVTKIVAGLDLPDALNLMARAMASQAEVSAAAYLPCGDGRGNGPLVAFRMQGFPASVAARCRMLDAIIGPYDQFDPHEDGDCEDFWAKVATAAPLGLDRPLWRVSVPPSRACGLVAAIPADGRDWLFDWAGGMAWLAFDGDAALVRQAATAAGGHAMLVRAPAATRTLVPTLHPQLSGLSMLEERLRRAFDPHGLFETGRF